MYKYRFWLTAYYQQERLSSKIWDVLGPSMFGNPFTLIWRYFSKRHSTLLDYLMKLQHCLVDITQIRVQMHISLLQLLKCYLSRELFESIMIIYWILCKLACLEWSIKSSFTKNMVLCNKSDLIMELVLVITCLGGWFGINCLSRFLKTLQLPK